MKIYDTQNEILEKLLNFGESVGNTTELIAQRLVLPTNCLHTDSSRLMNPYYLVGELLFNLGESNDLAFIGHYSKFWFRISDDGMTVRSAYFWQLTTGHGFNQIDHVIDMLRKNPDSRQAIVHFHHAHNGNTKDEICTLTAQFLIRRKKLHMIINMRSNDVIRGLPYDHGMFLMLQYMIANALDLRVGSYVHQAGSLHIYDRDLPEINPGANKEFYGISFSKEFFEDANALITWEEEIRTADADFRQAEGSLQSELAYVMLAICYMWRKPDDIRREVIDEIKHINIGLVKLLLEFEKEILK